MTHQSAESRYEEMCWVCICVSSTWLCCSPAEWRRYTQWHLWTTQRLTVSCSWCEWQPGLSVSVCIYL